MPNLNYNFQYVRDKIKTIKSQEYETVPTPQTRIDLSQKDVA